MGHGGASNASGAERSVTRCDSGPSGLGRTIGWPGEKGRDGTVRAAGREHRGVSLDEYQAIRTGVAWRDKRWTGRGGAGH